MDLMSRAMEELRLHRARYCREEVSAPAILSSDTETSAVVLVERGAGVLRVGPAELALEAGDVLLFPRGGARSIAPVRGAGPLGVLTGELVWASPDHPILRSLPVLLQVPGKRLAASPHWENHLASLRAELDRSRPGAATLLVRLTDVLLIEAMRMQPPPHGGAECAVTGWLRAAEDGNLGPVLTRIHAEPGRAWTVASLAEIAGQSRSAFAAHFATIMNETPMAYLARWRMFHARILLLEGTLSMDAIASRIGYGSAAAFSLAFTREHGVSPGVFRRQARDQATPGSAETAS